MRAVHFPARATALLLSLGLSLLLVVGAAGLTGGSATAADTPKSTPCGLDTELVPSCGILWGAAPAAFSPLSPGAATVRYEAATNAHMDIFHSYHRADQLFPTVQERELALGGEQRRLLMTNWKPSLTHTWRQIADGAVDARIDRLGRYIAQTYDRPFFFVIWHEPENDVNPAAGSGMTASDYRAMFRHVETRLKAAGATKLVFVMDYQGYPRFAVEPWYPDLWPGKRYVDWIASDSYQTGAASGWNSGDFHDMVNRAKGSWPGFYDYWSERFPNKPLMLAEWGVFVNQGDRQAWFFNQVRSQLADYPNLKGMVYFNSALTPRGDGTTLDYSAASRAAYRQLTDSLQRVTIPSL